MMVKLIQLSLLFIILLFSTFSYSQTSIKGEIKNIENGEVIPYAVISLLPYQSNKIFSFGTSDINGKFQLNVKRKIKLFDIKVNNVAFETYHTTIAVEEGKSNIFITIEMIPKTTTLDEVAIREYSPIIVKKDTTIYDIKHYTESSDQTLEEVLARIAGIKIDSEGNIEVNGQQVNKVLINNEEVTDVGAALISKSIDPSLVENIEVRFNEKDNKIKDSILDENKLVVLDIKLKNDFDTSLFGKIRGTIGTNDLHTQGGGYANIFSLKKNIKHHFFAEYDGFGHQSISLHQIKNIGKETLNQIFSTPANFEALSEKETFNEDIYGIDAFYNNNQQATVGLSTKVTLSKKSSLYLGSYNQLPIISTSQQSTQHFLTTNNTEQFINTTDNQSIASKNKLEYRFDTDSLKVKLNSNFIINNFNGDNLNSTNTNQYISNLENKGIQFYQNAIFEYKTKLGIGIQWKGNFSLVEDKNRIQLHHNDDRYSVYLQDEEGNTIFDFAQDRTFENQKIIHQISLNYKYKIGNISLGYLYLNHQLQSNKVGYNLEDNNILNDQFTAKSPSLHFVQNNVFVKYQYYYDWFDIDIKGGINAIDYSDQNQTLQQKVLPNINSRFNVNAFNVFNFSIAYKQFPSAYLLSHLSRGNDLVSFNTVYTPPSENYSPQNDQVLDANMYKNFIDYNFMISLGTLIGSSLNGNINNLDTYPFITQIGGQLPSTYQIGYLTLEKSFAKTPLFFVLEPAFLNNINTNISNEKGYKNISKRYILKFQNYSTFKKLPFNYDLTIRYSKFNFESESSTAQDQQDLLHFKLKNNIYFFNRKLAFIPYMDFMFFYNGTDAQYLNWGGEIRYSKKNINLFLTGYNLSNSTDFIMQNLDPSVYTISKQNVFGRYVKLGIEVKLK